MENKVFPACILASIAVIFLKCRSQFPRKCSKLINFGGDGSVIKRTFLEERVKIRPYLSFH